MKDLLKNVVHQGMKDDDDDMEGERRWYIWLGFEEFIQIEV
jgi:hypothetical protein